MKLLWTFLVISVFFVFGCKAKHRATLSKSKSIEEKYSRLLGINKENILNKKLYSFVDEWYGTPYKYGGKTKKGIDCSGFVQVLFKEIYGKEVEGSSLNIYTKCNPVSKEELTEGDLVFFKIDSKNVSHIGIYLQNNKFVHATTKAGVMINDLNEEYYRKYFAGSGKLR